MNNLFVVIVKILGTVSDKKLSLKFDPDKCKYLQVN